MKRIAVLWSGGFDSSAMVYFLASKNYQVKPYHVLIRNGGGKDAREKSAVDKIWHRMKDSYPNVDKPARIKYKIKPCKDRNQKLIKLLKNKYGEKTISLGSYVENSRYVKDNDKNYLSKTTKCEVITFDSFGIKNKQDIASVVKKLNLEDMIKVTWSCQLWFKKPCNKCFSCKNRKEALKII